MLDQNRCLAPLIAAVALLASSPSVAATGKLSDCIQTPNPPTCIVDHVIKNGDQEPDDVLTAVVTTGSVELVIPNSAILADGSRSKVRGSSRFLEAMGVNLPPDQSEVSLRSAQDDLLVAAIALAAAAQNVDDPFADPTVKHLMSVAKNDAAIAQMTAMIWYEIPLANDPWSSDATIRPRGMNKVWDAIIASPPSDVHILIELGNDAWWSGFQKKAEALLNMAKSRPISNADDKAGLASKFARLLAEPDVAESLLESGGDKANSYDIDGIRLEIAAARLARASDQRSIDLISSSLKRATKSSSIYVNEQFLDALKKANALPALKSVGDAFVAEARVQDDPEERGNWFGLASGAYRRAGATLEAVTAAREGLESVPAAVLRRNGTRNGTPTPREAAVNANGFGTNPVRALYLAGEREEAVKFGYLTGYDRYKFAREANESPNPMWLIEDKSEFYLQDAMLDLVYKPDRSLARRMYEALSEHPVPDTYSTEPDESLLGTYAALAGERDEMLDHFRRAVTALHENGYFALDTAAIWRKGEVILQRPVFEK